MAEIAGRVSLRSSLRRRVRRAGSGVLFAATLLHALPAHGLRQLARLPAWPRGGESEEVSLRLPSAARVPLDRASAWPGAHALRATRGGVLDEADVRAALAELVARKQAGEELAVAPPVEALTRFIEAELQRLDALNEPEDAAGEVEDLNGFFRRYALARTKQENKPPEIRFRLKPPQFVLGI